MSRTTILLMLLGAFGAASFASTPVATVSSGQPFMLDGHSISAIGIASWPVVVGDEIATSTAPAVVFFNDGSRISLASKSTVKISGTTSQPVLVLLTGSLDYRLVKGSKVSLAKVQTSAGGQPTTYSITGFAKSRISPVIIATAAAAGIAAPAAALLASSHGANATLGASPSTGATAGSASTVSGSTATPTVTTSSAAGGTTNLATPSLLKVPPLSHFQ